MSYETAALGPGSPDSISHASALLPHLLLLQVIAGGVGMCPLWNGKQQDSPATPRCIGGDAAANGGSQASAPPAAGCCHTCMLALHRIPAAS